MRNLADVLSLGLGDASLVCGNEVPCEDAGHLATLVERHLQRERRAAQQREVALLLEDRVALGDAPRGVWMREHVRAVVAHHDVLARDTRNYALSSARVAGKDVRLDEPDDDPHIGVYVTFVERNVGAVRRSREMR